MAGKSQRRKKTTPLFGELAEYEQDDWWKNILQEMSDGIFPHKVNYANSTLYYRTKSGKYENIEIDSSLSPKILLKRVKDFLEKTVKLIPSKYFDTLDEKQIGVLTWKQLSKNDLLRRIAIWVYLSDLGLSEEDSKIIEREIWWGFSKGVWVEKTFTIQGNKIIDFDPNIVLEQKKTRK